MKLITRICRKIQNVFLNSNPPSYYLNMHLEVEQDRIITEAVENTLGLP
jgi:hypothetical protein